MMKTIQAFEKFKFSIMIMVFLSFFLIFVSSLYAAEHSVMILTSDLHTSVDLSERVDEYKERVKDLDEQIRDHMDAVDWLSLKMKRISDSEREAAQNLVISIEKKRFTIKRLLKERQRYNGLIKSLLDKIRQGKPEKKSEKKAYLQPKQPGEYSKQDSAKQNADLDIAQLISEIKKANLSDWIEITENGGCLKLTTTLPILFPVGSADIANEYKSFFMRLAKFLKVYNVKIMVNGFADIDPIHNKKYPSNFELGAIRAANVVHELIKNGLKPSIFQIYSPGKYRFSANGELKQKALERRAEVTIVFIG
ncbi:MAG: OmpA family protein [Desulfobacteraceae bacterium]|nr:OmpA family protein [Desulfobacteraceae bacterium]